MKFVFNIIRMQILYRLLGKTSLEPKTIQSNFLRTSTFIYSIDSGRGLGEAGYRLLNMKYTNTMFSLIMTLPPLWKLKKFVDMVTLHQSEQSR